jgi:hypothetical protein
MQVGLAYLLFFFYLAPWASFSTTIIRLIALILFGVYIVIAFVGMIKHCKSDGANKAQKMIDITNAFLAILFYSIEIVCNALL